MVDSFNLFRGERALVTGSASNIGRAIAEALAREGAELLLADVDPVRNRETAATIRAAGGVAEELTVDLAQRDGWHGLINAIGDRPVHMLVHSASPPRKEADHLSEVSEETFDAMLGVNVRSGFLLARELGKRMQSAGIRGRMLFVTSLHAETPRNLPHYSASKAGQTMLVKELARAFGPAGIRVNGIAPGAVVGGGFNASAFSFNDKIPLGRPGRADDLTGPAVALLADRFCGYVTGTTLVVDGGLATFNWIPPAAQE
ncbi:MAG: SDR family NAD(P)-dependent oxidoreductase [Hyphomicrobiaceae bacterium]